MKNTLIKLIVGKKFKCLTPASDCSGLRGNPGLDKIPFETDEVL